MNAYIQKVNDWFAVAGQLDANDMKHVSEAGFKSVIINRPDYEAGPHQPPSDQVMQAARDAGMEVRYQPVISGALTEADAILFAQLLEQLPKPILAYCRSGGRCFNLFVMASAV